MTAYVALVRGINVGGATKVAMADLRDVFADLGYTAVRTVLNSGNVLFETPDSATADLVERIGEAMGVRLGIRPAVVVLTAQQLGEVVAANPLASDGRQPSRLAVAFPTEATDAARLRPLLDRDWGHETLAVGPRAAYLWCPDGLAASPLAQAVGRELGGTVTTRNWNTVLRIRRLLAGEAG